MTAWTILMTAHTSQDSFYKWTKISSLEIEIFELKMMVKCGTVGEGVSARKNFICMFFDKMTPNIMKSGMVNVRTTHK